MQRFFWNLEASNGHVTVFCVRNSSKYIRKGWNKSIEQLFRPKKALFSAQALFKAILMLRKRINAFFQTCRFYMNRCRHTGVASLLSTFKTNEINWQTNCLGPKKTHLNSDSSERRNFVFWSDLVDFFKSGGLKWTHDGILGSTPFETLPKRVK